VYFVTEELLRCSGIRKEDSVGTLGWDFGKREDLRRANKSY